jgi:signal transduction histidine kinase
MFAVASIETVPYTPAAGEETVVVIEVSGNRTGGPAAVPWLKTRPVGNRAFGFTLLYFPLWLFGGMSVATMFCLFLPAQTFKRKKMLSLAALLFSLLLHFLTTKDMVPSLSSLFMMNLAVMPVWRYLTGALLFCAHLVHLFVNRAVRPNKIETGIFAGINGAAAAAYFALSGSALQIIPICVSLASLLWVACKLTLNAENKEFFIHVTIHFFLLAAFFLEAIDSLGLITFGFEAAFSVILFVLLMSVVFFNFQKMRESQKKLLLTARYEKEITEMKMQASKAQIKPHFIFNSLSAIQAIYRKNPKDGEETLERFANHLRTNVDSDKKNLIPFEQELKNTLNYFELENLRYEKALTLILDIEYGDFLMPPLSLQPLLENAVKHGYTHEKPDGKIEISARADSFGTVTVAVSDNGRGFDPDCIHPDAVGLRNAVERLKYTLDAVVTVKSAVGAGTTITVSIPKKEEKTT